MHCEYKMYYNIIVIQIPPSRNCNVAVCPFHVSKNGHIPGKNVVCTTHIISVCMCVDGTCVHGHPDIHKYIIYRTK